jgi:hypothetical protein
LTRKTGKKFYNISSLNFERLLDDPQNIESNFTPLKQGTLWVFMRGRILSGEARKES